jgi:chromosome segregation ATPase
MGEIIDAVTQLAQDQGIANVISLALVWVILNMQRAQNAETRQQNRLISQLELSNQKYGAVETTVKQQGSSIDHLANQIKSDSAARTQIVADGIATIATQTTAIKDMRASTDNVAKGIEEMKAKLDNLEAQMEAVKSMIEEIKNSMDKADTDHQQLDDKLEGITSTIAEVLEQIGRLKERAESPTQKIELETPTVEAPKVKDKPQQNKEVSQ